MPTFHYTSFMHVASLVAFEQVDTRNGHVLIGVAGQSAAKLAKKLLETVLTTENEALPTEVIEDIRKRFIAVFNESYAKSRQKKFAGDVVESIGILRISRKGQASVYKYGKCVFKTLISQTGKQLESGSEFSVAEAERIVMDLKRAEVVSFIESLSEADLWGNEPIRYNYPFALTYIKTVGPETAVVPPPQTIGLPLPVLPEPDLPTAPILHESSLGTPALAEIPPVPKSSETRVSESVTQSVEYARGLPKDDTPEISAENSTSGDKSTKGRERVWSKPVMYMAVSGCILFVILLARKLPFFSEETANVAVPDSSLAVFPDASSVPTRRLPPGRERFNFPAQDAADSASIDSVTPATGDQTEPFSATVAPNWNEAQNLWNTYMQSHESALLPEIMEELRKASNENIDPIKFAEKQTLIWGELEEKASAFLLAADNMLAMADAHIQNGKNNKAKTALNEAERSYRMYEKLKPGKKKIIQPKLAKVNQLRSVIRDEREDTPQ